MNDAPWARPIFYNGGAPRWCIGSVDWRQRRSVGVWAMPTGPHQQARFSPGEMEGNLPSQDSMQHDSYSRQSNDYHNYSHFNQISITDSGTICLAPLTTPAAATTCCAARRPEKCWKTKRGTEYWSGKSGTQI